MDDGRYKSNPIAQSQALISEYRELKAIAKSSLDELQTLYEKTQRTLERERELAKRLCACRISL